MTNFIRYSALSCLLMAIVIFQVVCDSTGSKLNTAEYVTSFRAINALDPDKKVRNPDYLAAKFLSDDFWIFSRFPLNFSASRDAAKSEGKVTFFFVNARTHHIDTLLKQEVARGVKQVVILGAGLDSRAYRFREAMPRVHFFEVDLPDMQNQKKDQVIKILGALPSNVTYVPIDFNKETLKTVLEKTGYKASLKTYFIFEGVTYYIIEEGVSSTINFIAQNSAPGSSVIFDYMVKRVIKGDYSGCPDMEEPMRDVANIGEPWIFGMEKDEAQQFVHERGLKVLSDIGGKKLTELYLVRSDGQVDYWLSDCWRMMHACVK